jgi:hypothetical protein
MEKLESATKLISNSITARGRKDGARWNRYLSWINSFSIRLKVFFEELESKNQLGAVD